MGFRPRRSGNTRAVPGRRRQPTRGRCGLSARAPSLRWTRLLGRKRSSATLVVSSRTGCRGKSSDGKWHGSGKSRRSSRTCITTRLSSPTGRLCCSPVSVAHLAGPRGDACGACGIPLFGAPRRPTQCRPHRPGASACLRRAGRSTGDLWRGASRADRASDLPLRGSGPLLVLDAADFKSPRRRSGQGAGGPRSGCGHRTGAAG